MYTYTHSQIEIGDARLGNRLYLLTVHLVGYPFPQRLVVSVFGVIPSKLIFHMWNINLAFHGEMGFGLLLCQVFDKGPSKPVVFP